MSDVSQPQISVIMPVYNAERYLVDAIESILGQSYENFEFLIVNDGSTDSSKNIIDKFASMDSRIRSWDRDNDGLVSALNFMLDKANGQYIARMDADDVSLPNRFSTQLAFMESHPEIGLCGTSLVNIDQSGRPLFRTLQPLEHDEIDGLLIDAKCCISHPSMMARAYFLSEVGGYRKEFQDAEDLDLYLRMAEKTKLANLPEYLLQYRLHDQSVSGSRQGHQRMIAMSAGSDARKRRGIFDPVPILKASREAKTTGKLLYNEYLSYAWRSWAAGYRKTWLHYSVRSIKLRPLSSKSWKVLLIGFIKRPKASSS